LEAAEKTIPILSRNYPETIPNRLPIASP
jgi:hypothetical protein